MDKQDFYQWIKIILAVGALILAILFGLKILNISEAILKLVEVKYGINYIK